MNISKTLSKYNWLEGKLFVDPDDTRAQVMKVLGVEKGALDYVQVTPTDPGINRSWSRWAPHVAALVMLYEANEILHVMSENLVDSEEHLHPSQGFVYDDCKALFRMINKLDVYYASGEVEPVRDQYGHPVPEDLVCLPNLAQSREMEDCGELPEIVLHHIDWYEIQDYGLLVAPLHQIPDSMRCFFGDIDDLVFDKSPLAIDFVVALLRRYSFEDGFYHA